MDGKTNGEVDHVRQVMLTTMETMLEIQLQAVRTMIKDLGHQPKAVVRRGRRSQSLHTLTVEILRDEDGPLHVARILDELRQRYGRVVARDSISGVLGKAVNAGVLRKTARATFELVPEEDGL